jgi:hypothetical protein
MLLKLARDYDELADDLELGTAAIRHPELLPSRSIQAIRGCLAAAADAV